MIQDDMGRYKLELETFARYNIIIFKGLKVEINELFWTTTSPSIVPILSNFII